jgi:uncharacterized membrane protein YoaK (UPF0700 family)
MEKTFNQSKSWIYRAVGLLSFNGGFVNSITFESFFHNPVGYVTGNITFAASYLYVFDIKMFLGAITAIGTFLLGSILSGIIIPHNNFERNNKYNLLFQIEAILIFMGMIGLIFSFPTSKYLLSIALGLQNGSTSYYGKSIIRTTHMTGTMTDLGIMLAHKFIKKHDIPFWRIHIYLSLILGFFIGSVLGIIAFHLFSYAALTISCLICLAMVKFNFIKAPK